MKLYNTMTRRKDTFKPVKAGEVGMYVCGPTVYGPAHLGHASTAIAFDIIRRGFEYLGYKVKHIVNLTDVHDDVIKRAAKLGVTIFELTDEVIGYYMRDLTSLNVLPATVFPRVTENIEEIVDHIKILVDKGFAYDAEDGVYFAVSKYAKYGRLSGIRVDAGRSGQRIDTDKYDKDTAADFVLWKKWKEGEPYWESPWGRGRPGWHIECSVMSRRFLGQPFDIHGGALDLRFPHHENEIAQSEAAYDAPLANIWMHAGLLKVNGQKMSRSAGNFFEIPNILEKYDALVLRYWRATVRYRSEINYSDELMESAKTALSKLRSIVLSLKDKAGKSKGTVNKAAQKRFIDVLEDDFNMPEAVAVLWEVTKDAKISDADKLATILDFDRVLGVGLADVRETEHKTPVKTKNKIEQLIAERNDARANKDWETADRIRKELDELRVVIIDTPDGTTWRAS